MTSTGSRHGGHARDGHGDSHTPGAGADKRYLLTALGLLAALMLGEVITAVLRHPAPADTPP